LGPDSATGEQEYEFEDGGDEFEELLHDEDGSQDENDDDGEEEDEDDEEEDIQRFKTPLSVNTISALKKRAKPTGGRTSLLPKGFSSSSLLFSPFTLLEVRQRPQQKRWETKEQQREKQKLIFLYLPFCLFFFFFRSPQQSQKTTCQCRHSVRKGV